MVIAYHAAIPDINSPVVCQHDGSHLSIKDLTGLTDDRIVVLGPRRIPPVASPVANTDDGISINTLTGFRHLPCEDYYDALSRLEPEMMVGLSDLVFSEAISSRRRETMIDRTWRFLTTGTDELLSSLRPNDSYVQRNILAPVLPIGISEQTQYLESVAGVDGPRLVSGLAIYRHCQALDLPLSLASVVKFALHDIGGPHELLDAVSSGIDVLIATFIDQATDAGLCLCFSFDGPLPARGTDRSELAVDMWSTSFATDTQPLINSCDCYACQRHSRAYIQHLLNAKEMLAWTLLQLHNINVVQKLFESIRSSIAQGSFQEKRDAFHKRYEYRLPAQSGRGPRQDHPVVDLVKMPFNTALTRALGIKSLYERFIVNWPFADMGQYHEQRRRSWYLNLTLLPSINPPDYPGYARAIIEEGIRIVETAGNSPGPVIKMFKEAGCTILHKCTTIRHAKSAVKLGVDFLSIDGFECAGHVGETDITNFILLSRARQDIKTPFIASGGFADGQGLAAALQLGAEGINMGTRFMCTAEAPIHSNIKQSIVDAQETDTQLVLRRWKNTSRLFKNKVTEEATKIEQESTTGKFEEVQPLVSGQRGRQVFLNGDKDHGVWTAGQVIGLIHDIPTCDELVKRIESEAIESLRRTATLYSDAVASGPASKL
ncbi:MAG: hypothetical protein Q9159_002666 [Coniocarpon cinnabarinum]